MPDMRAHLIYVIGASGSGKDSLIRYGRERLSEHPGVVFAHRYITRPADAGGENHVALSQQEFDAREQARLFALSWRSHGNAYGIGIEINQWLAKDITVVVNGSREYLSEARRRYPDMLPVWIEVSPEVLRSRLEARGRENAAAIEARLARNRATLKPAGRSIIISNDGSLAEAGEEFVATITSHARQFLCA